MHCAGALFWRHVFTRTNHRYFAVWHLRFDLPSDTQLCSTYHDLAKAHDESLTTHAVVLDFKKAFNKVPYSLLLQKLRQIPEINPQIVNEFKTL